MSSVKIKWVGFDDWQIKNCSKCGAQIVLLESKSGSYYPVNFLGLREVIKTDFHKCGQKTTLTGLDLSYYKL